MSVFSISPSLNNISLTPAKEPKFTPAISATKPSSTTTTLEDTIKVIWRTNLVSSTATSAENRFCTNTLWRFISKSTWMIDLTSVTFVKKRLYEKAIFIPIWDLTRGKNLLAAKFAARCFPGRRIWRSTRTSILGRNVSSVIFATRSLRGRRIGWFMWDHTLENVRSAARCVGKNLPVRKFRKFTRLDIRKIKKSVPMFCTVFRTGKCFRWSIKGLFVFFFWFL